MICYSCREAGRILKATTTDELPNVIEALRMLHAQCAGGNWCDCAHRIPEGGKDGPSEEEGT